MYLSADRLALANKTALETFEQCSIAWQSIPHWDTGDPGQTQVRSDVLDKPSFLDFEPDTRKDFQLTLAQTSAPTPDSLLAEVMAATALLAKDVDKIVLKKLYGAATTVVNVKASPTPDEILPPLITARADIEDEGYRAPSCLITNTNGLIALTQLSGGYPVTEGLLTAANVNSLQRATNINTEAKDEPLTILVLGRRQLIPHGCAGQASPGEEPVDLAVSVMPSVGVVGETDQGTIALAVRVRFAIRIKAPKAVVAIYKKP
jgi:hypothetical protein